MYTNYYSFLEIFKNIFQQNDEKCSFESFAHPLCPTVCHPSFRFVFVYNLQYVFFRFLDSHSAAHMVINEALNRA